MAQADICREYVGLRKYLRLPYEDFSVSADNIAQTMASGDG